MEYWNMQKCQESGLWITKGGPNKAIRSVSTKKKPGDRKDGRPQEGGVRGRHVQERLVRERRAVEIWKTNHRED